MRAGLAAPDLRIVHTRLVVEHKRSRVRKLHAASRRQDQRKRIVAEKSVPSDRHDRPPAMRRPSDRVARGAGDLAAGLLVESGVEKGFDGAAHLGLVGNEISACDRRRERWFAHMFHPRLHFMLRR